MHRQTAGLNKQAASGSMSHFVWQQQYELGDDVIDSQHKDLFNLAQVLIASHTKEELLKNIHLIYQHVKEHFVAEESLMQELNYHGLQEHNKEHNMMLKN